MLEFQPEIKRRRVGRDTGDGENGTAEDEHKEGLLSSNTHVKWPVVRATKAELDATCARWCRVLEDGSYSWDMNNLKCFLAQEERDDRLLVRNIIHGTILSGQVHPLIFDAASEHDHEMVRLRSVPFLEQLLADERKGVPTYPSLSDEQKSLVAVGVRDLFLAKRHGFLDEREKRILDGMVGLLDETLGCVHAVDMNISFHPSTNFTVVKVIENLDDMMGNGWKEWGPLFAQVMDAPRLFVVFVDPVELSFHNLENIIPLDRWFESKLGEEGDKGESWLSLSSAHQIQPARAVWTCKLRGAACDLLKQASSLDLYVAPLNKATRGGERFIFHSALLSKALTGAVRESGLLNRLAHGRLAKSFEFVNYVFRCNRFPAGNSTFSSHLDTPYYDKSRAQVSKYTLLIYLTAGKSDPALRVQDVDLDEIEEMSCVIFSQQYEHEGKAFMENEKVFLRTELVFTDQNLDHDDRIAPLFSEACYMTRQSAFDDTLTSYAHDCFERANSLHWAIEREAAEPPVYLHKHLGGMHFLANGHTYWFPKSDGVDILDCAVVAILDYFNCKIDGRPFNSLCRTQSIRKRFSKTEDIWAQLSKDNPKEPRGLKRLQQTDFDSLLPKSPSKPFVRRVYPGDEDEDTDEDEIGEACCPFHAWTTFDAWEDEFVQKVYEVYCDFTRKSLAGFPLLVLDQELVINESHIKIVADKIYFLEGPNGKPIAPINFAACWGGALPEAFIALNELVSVPRLLIPPLMWHESDHGYQLVLDFFRNDWMVRVDDDRTIPVPVISNDPNGEDGDFLAYIRQNPSKLPPKYRSDLEDCLDSDTSRFGSY